MLCLPKGIVVTSIGKEVPKLKGSGVLLLSSSETKITSKKDFLVPLSSSLPPCTRDAPMGAAFGLVEEAGG